MTDEEVVIDLNLLENIEEKKVRVCIKYGLPLCQSYLINLQKAKDYLYYCQTPEYRLECFLDYLDRKRKELEEREE